MTRSFNLSTSPNQTNYKSYGINTLTQGQQIPHQRLYSPEMYCNQRTCSYCTNVCVCGGGGRGLLIFLLSLLYNCTLGWSDFSFFNRTSFTMDCLCIWVHKVGQDQNFQVQGQSSIFRATGRCPRSSAYNFRISKYFEKSYKIK